MTNSDKFLENSFSQESEYKDDTEGSTNTYPSSGQTYEEGGSEQSSAQTSQTNASDDK